MHIHLRYTHKKDNGVANIAGDVLWRLKRMVRSLKGPDAQTSVKDFNQWKRYKGKLRNWFEGNIYFKICPKIR